jgi:hypothetical protein
MADGSVVYEWKVDVLGIKSDIWFPIENDTGSHQIMPVTGWHKAFRISSRLFSLFSTLVCKYEICTLWQVTSTS